ncbi:tetratricopeptide repeat protein [Vibrio alfacsensis]|uniref:tetratricopeptide repeat protein n=1 Tax=Vibrio alfacsensis TaxID=1074311 RepID=UPI004067AB0F
MNRSIIISTLIFLAACSSSEHKAPFYSELYQGRPIDTLNIEEKPLSELDAIKRGDAALSLKNTDLALYHYISALEFVNGVYRDKALLKVGQIHSARGNHELAEKALLLALETNPNNVEVLEKLGRDYSKKGDVENGLIYFSRAINADQVRLNSRFSFSYDTSIKQLESLKRDENSPALAYLGLGILYDLDAQHSIAQALYRYALEIKPRSSKAMMNMGYSYYMEGNYAKARHYTLQAIKLDANNDKAQNNLALIYLAQNDDKSALNVFMRIMEAPEALNNVGYFMMLQGKSAQAVTYFQQAIDKKPYYYKVANENLERALMQLRTDSESMPITR